MYQKKEKTLAENQDASSRPAVNGALQRCSLVQQVITQPAVECRINHSIVIFKARFIQAGAVIAKCNGVPKGLPTRNGGLLQEIIALMP